MGKRFLEIGKIVSTHGVRGEMRVNPWCQNFDLFKQSKELYLDGSGREQLTVTGVRKHGNIVLLKAEQVDTMEKAQALRNRILYMDKESVTLRDGEYFVQDIIGCKVYDISDGEFLGDISAVSETGANDVWHIDTPGGEQVLIPKIPLVVKEVDVESKKVLIEKMKGLFDDEN